jgi:hypothetical protein
MDKLEENERISFGAKVVLISVPQCQSVVAKA